MISIIIPTRNRPKLLEPLVQYLVKSVSNLTEVIVVDSSDEEKIQSDLKNLPRVKYIVTKIKSAAVQRNIGLDNLGESDFVFFLDDDTWPSPDYFDSCLTILKAQRIVGVSGIAQNPLSPHTRRRPKGLVGVFQIVFLLDSCRDGVLLKSGVNIPIRLETVSEKAVDWLIGCAAWNRSAIGETRFEAEFIGQSLAEDVVFSVRMGKKGLLVTDPRILLLHEESTIGRPSKEEFWRMWVKNRKRVVEVADFGWLGLISFWWANLGQLIVLSYSKVKTPEDHKGSIKGLLKGCLDVLRVLP